MTEQEHAVLMLRGLIASLPETDQKLCKECETELRAIVAKYGDFGKVVAGVIAAEFAAQG